MMHQFYVGQQLIKIETKDPDYIYHIKIGFKHQ